MSPLALSLLHSLWQAGVVWLLVEGVLLFLPARRADIRYAVALAGLVGVWLLWLATWTLLEPEARWGVPGWSEWAVWIWRVGVVAGFWRMARSLGAAQRLARQSAPAPPEWAAVLRQLCAEYGVRAAVRLRVSWEVASPVLVGVWRYVVLLPAPLLASAPPEVVRAALAHEVAHLARRDAWVNLFQMGVEALFFFNPLVWALGRRVRQEREAAADALALQSGLEREAYAGALLWWSRGGPPLAGALGVQGGNLRERLLRLLQPGEVPRGEGSFLRSGGVVLLVAAVLLLAGLGVRAAVRGMTGRERVALLEQLAAPYLYEGVSADAPKRTFSGRVVDAGGDPVAGAYWKAWNSFHSDEGKTGPDGFFQGVIAAGGIDCVVQAEGYAPAARRFEKGEDYKEFTLRPGVAFEVRCRDAEGKAVPAGAEVILRIASFPTWRVRTGADGVARFSHLPEEGAAEVWVRAGGYRAAHAGRVVVKEAFTLSLVREDAPYRIRVVDEKSGAPVEGVQASIQESWPAGGAHGFGRTVCTDAEGYAEFPGLNPELAYGLWVWLDLPEGGRRATRARIDPARTPEAEVRLPRERFLKVKIQLPPGDARESVTFQYSIKTETHGSFARHATVPVQGGVAEVTLRGLTPERVAIYFDKKWYYSPALEAEQSDYLLRVPTPERKVPVVLRLTTGKNGAPPAGKLVVRIAEDSDYHIYPVKNGEVAFEAPAGSRFRLENISLLGGTVDENMEYTVGEQETRLKIPVQPAGAFRVQVREPGGELAEQVFIFAVGKDGKKAFDIKDSACTGGDAREWFLSPPMPLAGARYRILAVQGGRYKMSLPVRLTEASPVAEVVLTLPEPEERVIWLTHAETGKPAADVVLDIRTTIPNLLKEALSGRIQSDAQGRAVLILGRGDTAKRTLIPTGGGTARLSQPWAEKVALPAGRKVAGRLVDVVSGKGVPDNRVRWVQEGIGGPEIQTREDGSFEFDDLPPGEVFLMIPYPAGRTLKHEELTLHPEQKEVVIKAYPQ